MKDKSEYLQIQDRLADLMDKVKENLAKQIGTIGEKATPQMEMDEYMKIRDEPLYAPDWQALTEKIMFEQGKDEIEAGQEISKYINDMEGRIASSTKMRKKEVESGPTL